MEENWEFSFSYPSIIFEFSCKSLLAIMSTGLFIFFRACFISWHISYGNEMPESIIEKAQKRLKKQAGYVKIFRPDFSKKNVAWAGFTGAIKGAVSAFSD